MGSSQTAELHDPAWSKNEAPFQSQSLHTEHLSSGLGCIQAICSTGKAGTAIAQPPSRDRGAFAPKNFTQPLHEVQDPW